MRDRVKHPVVGRKACPNCGSRDNVAIYANGGEHCWTGESCGYHVDGTGDTGAVQRNYQPTRNEMSGQVEGIKDRKISKATAKKFGVTIDYSSDGSIAHHWYPAFNRTTGEHTATKRRSCASKQFMWTGDRTDIGLFGQNTCSGRGKFLTITEGEVDALAVSEMFDRKWDVVSLTDGTGGAVRDIKDNLEWIDGYDSVVLCLDNDEAGKKCLDQIKDLFSPNKLKVCTLPLKDAGEMLVNGRIRDFTKSWWDAKAYLPGGIVKPTETWASVLKYRDTPMFSYPWAGLNDLTLGQRQGELNIWAAETGVGKSQAMREIVHWNQTEHHKLVGCLMLEESVAKSMLGWMSFHAGRPLHKELNSISDEELKKYWDMASQDDRFVLLDHKGWKNSIDTLKARMRYMARSMGCEVIVLDHLHIALSSIAGATGDWGGIDELVTELAALAVESDICLHLVSHVSESRSLRGSKGISKLADGLFFLERDKHAEDVELANTTTLVIDKNRFTGDTGIAGYLHYDKSTGRMSECSKPDEGGVPDEF